MRHRADTAHAETSTSPVETVLDGAAALLAGETAAPAAQRGATAPAGPVELLVAGAEVAVRQLEVVLNLTLDHTDARRLVPDLLRAAADFGIAGAAAVGAVAALVDPLLDGDAERLAGLILLAMDEIAPDELERASASLIAALSTAIARRLDLRPVEVHAEVRERWRTGQIAACHPGLHPDPSARRHRPGDQIWWGRNSQCHGSRGTASTQPKRGPFTLSH